MESILRRTAGQSSTHLPPLSNSSVRYFAGQALPAGYLGPDVRRTMMSVGNPIDLNSAMWREVEKAQIREEIIAKEMEHKRLLEAEVRREMMVEREMALRRGERLPLLSATAPGQLEPGISHLHHLSNSRSLGERLASRGIGGLEMAPFQPIITEGNRSSVQLALELQQRQGYHPGCVVGGLDELPFQRSSEIKMISQVDAPLEISKRKAISVAKKPEGHLSGTKRAASVSSVQGDTDPPAATSKKKVKQEWNCPICKLTATSQQSLKEHFRGKKHKSRVEQQKSQETARNYAIGFPTKNPDKPVDDQNLEHKEGELQQVKNTGGGVILREKPNSDVKQNLQEAGRQKSGFWCELCQVRTESLKVMNVHKKGKKHMGRLQRLNESGSSAHPGKTPHKKMIEKDGEKEAAAAGEDAAAGPKN